MPQDSVILKCCLICGERATPDNVVADAYGVYHKTCKNPETQIQVMEDQQIITAAAYFIAYSSVVSKGKILTNREIVDELKKYDNYDDTRLYRLIKDNENKIDEMVGVIFSATIPE